MLETIKLKATQENYTVLSEWLNKYIELWDLSADLANKMNICAEEIYINIVSYAYEKEPGTAEISIDKNNNSIDLVFEDDGMAYNPLQKEDPDTTLPLEERPVGGLGIFMVKQMANNVEYEYKDNKNALKLTFDTD